MTQLIHENLSVVMNFAFAKAPLEKLVNERFQGEWKYLNKALFEIPAQKAEKASLELALFLRLIDDEEDMSGYLAKTSNMSFGRLVFDRKPETDLKLRDVSNKIIHASDLKWDFSIEGSPKLICNSQEPKRWIRAEVDVVSLAAGCGLLMS